MTRYREALYLAKPLPRFGRVGLGAAWRSWRWGQRRWVASPLALLMVELHVIARLQTLLRLLRAAAMPLPEAGADGRRVRRAALRVERMHDEVVAACQTRTRGHLVRVPVVAFLTAMLVSVATDGASTRATVALFQSLLEWTGYNHMSRYGLATALATAALFSLPVLAVLGPPVVRLGFWAKRALLAGSGADGSAVHEVRAARSRLPGMTVPAASAYAAEDLAFAALGARKPREFPLDAFLSAPALLLAPLVGINLQLLRDVLRYEPQLMEGTLVLLAVLGGAFLLAAKPGVSAVLRRRREGVC